MNGLLLKAYFGTFITMAMRHYVIHLLAAQHGREIRFIVAEMTGSGETGGFALRVFGFCFPMLRMCRNSLPFFFCMFLLNRHLPITFCMCRNGDILGILRDG